MNRRWFLLLVVLCLPVLALAATVDPSGTAPVDWAALLAEVMARGPNTPLVAALVVFAAVYLTRTGIGVWVPWFRTDAGGATLALAYGLAAGALNAALQGAVTAAGLLAGLTAGFAAAGGWSTARKIGRALWQWLLERAGGAAAVFVLGACLALPTRAQAGEEPAPSEPPPPVLALPAEVRVTPGILLGAGFDLRGGELFAAPLAVGAVPVCQLWRVSLDALLFGGLLETSAQRAAPAWGFELTRPALPYRVLGGLGPLWRPGEPLALVGGIAFTAR